jgi:hypothetical protein
MFSPVREFRLAQSDGDGRHAFVNKNGAFIGFGVPLLEQDAMGRWRPRDKATLERLFARGYGVRYDMSWRMTQLLYVAQALNKNDLSLASIALVRAELLPLPSIDRARAMAKADGLVVKDTQAWEDEPRAPAGTPEGGQWIGPGSNVEGGSAGADVIQVAAAGDLPCQGFAGGCQSGGTYGTTAAYRISNQNLCRDCAVKKTGSQDVSGAEQNEILQPFEITPR